MEFRREEILPGVFLTALRTDKFKTALLSLSLLTQLDGETASMNAPHPQRPSARYRALPGHGQPRRVYGRIVWPEGRNRWSAVWAKYRLLAFTPPSRRTIFCPGGERLLEKAGLRFWANCF